MLNFQADILNQDGQNVHQNQVHKFQKDPSIFPRSFQKARHRNGLKTEEATSHEQEGREPHHQDRLPPPLQHTLHRLHGVQSEWESVRSNWVRYEGI